MGTTGAILQFIPIMIIGAIYALVVFLVARKRRINPWGWTIASLVPFFGIFVAAVFLITTLLSILDRLHVLEAKGEF
jgi:hypothetical protein